jgi:hypothetical protein
MDRNRKEIQFSLQSPPQVLSRREALASLMLLGVSATGAAAQTPGSAQSVLHKAVQYFNCNDWFNYRPLLDSDVHVHDVRNPSNSFRGQAAIDKLFIMVTTGGMLFVPYGNPTSVNYNKVSGYALWKDNDGSDPDKLYYTFEVRSGLITRMTTDDRGITNLPVNYSCPARV